MQCFIYKSLIREGLYLYVLHEHDFTDVPAALLQSMGPPELVMPLALTPERQLARADTVKVMKQLNEQGFYVQIPPTKLPAPDGLQ